MPSACRTENPYFATECYSVPMASAGAPAARAIVAFRDTPSNTGQQPLALMRNVGSVWGLA